MIRYVHRDQIAADFRRVNATGNQDNRATFRDQLFGFRVAAVDQARVCKLALNLFEVIESSEVGRRRYCGNQKGATERCFAEVFNDYAIACAVKHLK